MCNLTKILKDFHINFVVIYSTDIQNNLFLELIQIFNIENAVIIKYIFLIYFLCKTSGEEWYEVLYVHFSKSTDS